MKALPFIRKREMDYLREIFNNIPTLPFLLEI